MKETTYQGNVCYTYWVLEQVCLSVKQNDDPDTPDIEWAYWGGCFTGGRSATYVPAEPGNVYTFSDVMMTVRESEERTTSIWVFIFLFLGIASLVTFIALFIGGKQGLLPFGNPNPHRRMED